jgi:hypothetical protein
VKTALKDTSQVQQQAFVLNQQHARNEMIFSANALAVSSTSRVLFFFITIT